MDRMLLTVGVEDWFHVGSFDGIIARGRWDRFERRIEQSTQKALDLLARYEVNATFFVMGWIADQMPELVREIHRRGHEVASQGYFHRTIRQMSPTEFREDLARSREALERCTGRQVLGHRVPHFLTPSDLWALDVLAEEGYAYDSSVRTMLLDFAGEPWRRRIHLHEADGRSLWELPVSSWNVLGLSLPIAGGNYFRQLPEGLVRRSVESWHKSEAAPFVMYFHVWELDAEQPRINTASLLTRVRHYRNLDIMPRVLGHYFGSYDCSSIADYLGLEGTEVEAHDAPNDGDARPIELRSTWRTPVSIVIPCFNEGPALPYLANTLRTVEAALGSDYELRFLLVDDGSTDDTFEAAGRLFGGRTGFRVLRHDVNQGVAAAILTGIQSADTEIVCSMDCDCTYDPIELKKMIPLLEDGVDLVTASPYHPDGKVLNVPAWRLTLSKGASMLYRATLPGKLHTFTSCFRVYRRSAVQGIELDEGGFLGVAELLGKLLLGGSRIVEHPATLEVRFFGQSKMKTLRTIRGHLGLLAKLGRAGMLGPRSASPRQEKEEQ